MATPSTSSAIINATEPMEKWSSYSDGFPQNYNPNGLLDAAVEEGSVLNSFDTDSNWYFDKIFENPYISSTLYFFQSQFADNTAGILQKGNSVVSQTKIYDAERNSFVTSTEYKPVGDKFVKIAKCIVRQPSFSVDNRFDQSGGTPFSSINTKIFKSLKTLASFDQNGIGFGYGIRTQSGLITQLLDSMRQEESGFINNIIDNTQKLISGIKNSLNYLNAVQFESDAGLSRSFMANSISSPIHASFFFLQQQSSGRTNREEAYELLKYFLPYQQLYSGWTGEGGILTTLNPEMSSIVDDIRNSINETAESLGISIITDSVKDVSNKLFNGGVITTMAPGGYITSNNVALQMARNGQPDKRTFILTTPWGMRMNLLPSTINISESQSKVIVDNNKIVPLYIQIDVEFIPSRRLLTQDVISQVLNKYKSLQADHKVTARYDDNGTFKGNVTEKINNKN